MITTYQKPMENKDKQRDSERPSGEISQDEWRDYSAQKVVDKIAQLEAELKVATGNAMAYIDAFNKLRDTNAELESELAQAKAEIERLKQEYHTLLNSGHIGMSY